MIEPSALRAAKGIAITEHEQGAWWQVDLGGQKNIKQIIIYNRTTPHAMIEPSALRAAKARLLA
jgi:hypothetical protein